MNDVTFAQGACASFVSTASQPFQAIFYKEKTANEGKDETKNEKRSHRLKAEGRDERDGEGWTSFSRERINERTGARSINANVNDFNAGKIWWQFHLTIITTTRPHMSRCIRVTRNTLLYSSQRFHVIYRVQKHAYTACWESLQPFRESSPAVPALSYVACFFHGDKFNSRFSTLLEI